jgi:nitrate reductase alpha subunit
MMDNKLVRRDVRRPFTDFPLLVRTDNGSACAPPRCFPNYASTLSAEGPEQEGPGNHRRTAPKIGDFVVWDDEGLEFPQGLTRDMVGETLAKSGLARLDWKGTVKLVDGTEVEAATLVESLPRAPADYDLDSVAEMTSAPGADRAAGQGHRDHQALPRSTRARASTTGSTPPRPTARPTCR